VADELPVREWIRAALRSTEFHVDGEAARASEVEELVARRRPDVLLVDVHGDAAGIAVLQQIRAAKIEVPALLLAVSPERGFNENAEGAGAQGTVLTTGSIRQLLEALRAVVRGERSFDPRHPKRPPGQRELSPRERDVLRLVARGATNREIAGALGLGHETVKTLLARSCAKLGVDGRRDAAVAARGLGLL
jgi:DNA-binding NarL/FixJ family response regulator